jgi:hypothetical protein
MADPDITGRRQIMTDADETGVVEVRYEEEDSDMTHEFYDEHLEQFPVRNRSWFPDIYANEEERATLLRFLRQMESAYHDLEPFLSYHMLDEEDFYDGYMTWDFISPQNVYVAVLWDTFHPFSITRYYIERQGNVDWNYRYILYSVKEEGADADPFLVLLTVVYNRREVGPQYVFIHYEKEYYIFRMLVSGIRDNSHGIHAFSAMSETVTRDMERRYLQQTYGWTPVIVQDVLRSLQLRLRHILRGHTTFAGGKT